MLQLVKRCSEYVKDYKAYCQEAFDNNVIYFVPTTPLEIDDKWQVITGIGSIGYAVRVSEWGKGYGTEILKQGLHIARERNLKKVLLNINENNIASIRVCEKPGGKLWDKIESFNNDEGHHLMRRYWIYL